VGAQEVARQQQAEREAQAARFRSNTDAINNTIPAFAAVQSYVNAAQNLARSAFPDDPERQKGYVAAVKENAAESLEKGEDIKPYQVERSSMDRAREEERERERARDGPVVMER
jgi:signal transduction histidine kinase